MNSLYTPSSDDLDQRIAGTAHDALQGGQKRAGKLADAVEDLARRGTDSALQAGDAVREQALRLGDQTIGWIKDEPVKSVFIAAAVGAATALFWNWTTQTRAGR